MAYFRPRQLSLLIPTFINQNRQVLRLADFVLFIDSVFVQTVKIRIRTFKKTKDKLAHF